MTHSLQKGLRKLKKVLEVAIEPEYWQAAQKGVAASIELGKVPFVDARTVIDVGANRGQFATLALKRMSSAHVHSFEPGPTAIAKFNALYGRHPRVNIYPYALGSEKGHLSLHVPQDDDNASFITGRGKPVEVEIRTLDELSLPIERPCLLKIDVQGY